MDNQEVIECLDILKDRIDEIYLSDTNRNRHYRAINKAIEAIEKQEKIERIIDDYNGSHCIHLIKADVLLDELKEAVDWSE